MKHQPNLKNRSLTLAEQDELTYLEQSVASKYLILYEIAEDLEQIRDQQLYRESGTFDEYCIERWGLNQERD
jgi:hypothetical protein